MVPDVRNKIILVIHLAALVGGKSDIYYKIDHVQLISYRFLRGFR